MHLREKLAIAFLAFSMLALPRPAAAQRLGTFRWQQVPFCNVITLSVVQVGTVYQLSGFDDECGADIRSVVTGTAILNPEGSIGMGLTVVTGGGRSLHLDATIGVTSFSGGWRSDSGGAGAWVLTPGPGHPGNPRPLPVQSLLVVGTGVSVPATLTSQYSPSSLTETVVTPRAARLGLTMSLSGLTVNCGTSDRGLIFITLDGTPIRSSVVYTTGAFTGILSGATVAPVAAGAHIVAIGAQCFSGSVTSASYTVLTLATITVLP